MRCKAGQNIKIAMLLLQGCSSDKATDLLQQAGGRLRTALGLAGIQANSAPE